MQCHHLLDWIESDARIAQSIRDQARPLKNEANDLRTCEDLANRAKHSALTRSKAGDPQTGPIGNDVNVRGGGTASHSFRIESMGVVRDVLDLATDCISQWRSFLRQHNLI